MVGGLNGLSVRLKQGGSPMRNGVPASSWRVAFDKSIPSTSIPAEGEEKVRREHEYRVVTRPPAWRGIQGRLGSATRVPPTKTLRDPFGQRSKNTIR